MVVLCYINIKLLVANVLTKTDKQKSNTDFDFARPIKMKAKYLFFG